LLHSPSCFPFVLLLGSTPKWHQESFPFRVFSSDAKLTLEVFADTNKGNGDILLGTTVLSLDLLRQSAEPKW
jgi:Ca2+-dependent lipid-binding protein